MKNNLKNVIIISWIHLFLSVLGMLTLDPKSVTAVAFWALILYSLRTKKYLIIKISSSILILSGGAACALLIYTHPPFVFNIPLQIGMLIFMIFALEVIVATFILRTVINEDNKTKLSHKLIMKSASDSDYEQAYNEVNGGNKNVGLWARCLANALGDEAKARAEYITIRTQEITSSNLQLPDVLEQRISLLLISSIVLIGCIIILLLGMWISKFSSIKNDGNVWYGANYKYSNCNACLNGKCEQIPSYFGNFRINDSATAFDIQERNEKGVEVTTHHPITEKQKSEICDINKITHSFKCSGTDQSLDSTIEFNGSDKLIFTDMYKLTQSMILINCSVSRIN